MAFHDRCAQHRSRVGYIERERALQAQLVEAMWESVRDAELARPVSLCRTQLPKTPTTLRSRALRIEAAVGLPDERSATHSNRDRAGIAEDAQALRAGCC